MSDAPASTVEQTLVKCISCRDITKIQRRSVVHVCAQINYLLFINMTKRAKWNHFITPAAKTGGCIVRPCAIMPHFPLDGSHDSADRIRASERASRKEGGGGGGGQEKEKKCLRTIRDNRSSLLVEIDGPATFGRTVWVCD